MRDNSCQTHRQASRENCGNELVITAMERGYKVKTIYFVSVYV